MPVYLYRPLASPRPPLRSPARATSLVQTTPSLPLQGKYKYTFRALPPGSYGENPMLVVTFDGITDSHATLQADQICRDTQKFIGGRLVRPAWVEVKNETLQQTRLRGCGPALLSGMLGQDFFAVGRKYRYVDVWEFTGTGWRQIYAQREALVLDDRDAQVELGAVKVQYFRHGRIFRLWTWTGSAWDLTTQI